VFSSSGRGLRALVCVADRLRSTRTRRAYAGDMAALLGWLAARGTGALAARRVHVDLRAATQLDAGQAAASVRRRLCGTDHTQA
jgi:Phage integrase, N-terminal SAM-like domain